MHTKEDSLRLSVSLPTFLMWSFIALFCCWFVLGDWALSPYQQTVWPLHHCASDPDPLPFTLTSVLVWIDKNHRLVMQLLRYAELPTLYVSSAWAFWIMRISRQVAKRLILEHGFSLSMSRRYVRYGIVYAFSVLLIPLLFCYVRTYIWCNFGGMGCHGM